MPENNNQRSMHIVFLDFDDIRNPLLAAGQAKATLEVGKRLVKKGHKVTIISSKFPGYKNRIENGLDYRHIGLGSKNIRLNNVFYIATLPFAVFKIKADIIVECFTAPISTLFTPLFTKIPVVALSTSFEAERFSRKYHLPFWLIERIGCRFYRYFFPPTVFAEEKMKRMNPLIISKIIPEGVGKEFFKIKRGSPKHILFLGRLDADQKGIDLLLSAYAKISDNIEWPLVIAGKGPDESAVSAMIKKLKLGNRIKLVGGAYGDKKKQLLSEALFVALPSRHEGFSLFALEALAAGVPLATFDIPGLGWIRENAALKAKPFNVDEYSSLLEKMASDRQLLERMSFSSREFANGFTWENVADNFESFFLDTVLNKKRQSGAKQEILRENKKPVIFFSSYDDRNNPHYGGGGAFAVHEVAKRLIPRFEVHVLTGKYPNCQRREFLDGVCYERIGSCLFGPKLGHLIFHSMLPFYAVSKVFDAWIESFTPPFSTSFLPIFTKKPVIGLAHMLAAEDMLRKYKISFSFIENFGIKMYDNFIVLTEQSGNKIRKFNPGANIEVIPNGVNFSFPSGHFCKKYLLCIGRIEVNQKGLDLLLESYRLIAGKVDYPLVIAGQGAPEEEQKLKKMIDEFKLSNSVKFLGRVEGWKKTQIFEEAIAVIIPSRFETFSLVALEALAYGVPIISFDIEGLKWLPKKFSYKIKPFDIFTMAMMAQKISGKNNHLAIDRDEVKSFLKNHSWEIIADKFKKRIDSIIKLN